MLYVCNRCGTRINQRDLPPPKEGEKTPRHEASQCTAGGGFFIWHGEDGNVQAKPGSWSPAADARQRYGSNEL